MLVECPECKNAVSDKASTCPHCGIALSSTVTASATKLESRRKLKQWSWFFFWLFVAGIVWVVAKERDQSIIPGSIMINVGMWGWIGVRIRMWLRA
jgi:hypothetical protein